MIKIFTKNSNFLSNIEFYEYFHFKDFKNRIFNLLCK
jgi:hypothetical protein